ncbi:MAG: class I SAM-dependent methyltransferase [Chitinophagales bacterium]
MFREDYAEINRKLWDKRTGIHFESDFYGVEKFLLGEEILNSIETDLLGDVKNKALLHLQCHFGMDTLALARKGAIVTGIDLSEAAISKANELRKKMNLHADFICCNVYDTLLHTQKKFDIVFTSYGVIGWLPDLTLWAKVISKALQPGGVFVMAEFHPVVWMFNNEFNNIEYSYFNKQAIVETEQGTYAERHADIPENTSVTWNHGISEVLSALLHQGLEIEIFLEYDYSPYSCFNNSVEVAKNRFQIAGMEGKLPMVYALKARKK